MLLDYLEKRGFAFIDNEPKKLSDYFQELAAKNSIFSIKRQFLTSCNSSYGTTLTKIYGKEQFPLHTDGVQYRCPPRFIALIGNHECYNQTKTYLVDSSELIKIAPHICFNEIFKLKGNGFSVYTNLISSHFNGLSFFRYNPVLMKPIKKEVDLKLADAMRKLEMITFVLNNKSCLIIDNWRLLHSRGVLLDDHCPRKILRYEFYIQSI